MKPAAFDYHDPRSVSEALDLLAEHGDDAVVLAGGQSLVPLLNMRLARPGVVVDIGRVAGLDAVDDDGSSLTIGAQITATQFGARRDLDRFGGCAAQAIAEIGHPQIRNRTTVVGSIAHADPAAELPAVLLALDGSVVLTSRERGARSVPATAFFDGPFSTARELDELVTAVRFGDHPEPSTLVEVARRPGDFALTGAVVAVQPARVALFGVADRPLRIEAAEVAIADGAEPADVGEIVRSSVEPRDDVHATGSHRRHLAATLVARALARLTPSGAPAR